MRKKNIEMVIIVVKLLYAHIVEDYLFPGEFESYEQRGENDDN